jgi:hypothetical protein
MTFLQLLITNEIKFNTSTFKKQQQLNCKIYNLKQILIE